jgi:hypothetical protein
VEVANMTDINRVRALAMRAVINASFDDPRAAAEHRRPVARERDLRDLMETMMDDGRIDPLEAREGQALRAAIAPPNRTMAAGLRSMSRPAVYWTERSPRQAPPADPPPSAPATVASDVATAPRFAPPPNAPRAAPLPLLPPPAIESAALRSRQRALERFPDGDSPALQQAHERLWETLRQHLDDGRAITDLSDGEWAEIGNETALWFTGAGGLSEEQTLAMGTAIKTLLDDPDVRPAR